MAKGNSPLHSFYMLVGGIFSFFYIIVGILFLLRRITLGIDPKMANYIGTGILAYGLFRLYMFYKRYKAMREDE